MSRLGKTGATAGRQAVQARTTSAVTSASTTPDATTALGAPGHTRDARSELFLTGTGAFPVEDSFHEAVGDRADRTNTLARTIALEEDGVDWLTDFVRWARGEGNMRAIGLVIAVEATAARIEAGLDAGTRHLARAAIGRADEAGTLLKLWSDTYGKGSSARLPNALKRALADAATAKYDEYNLLKYDTPSADRRFADVLRLARPRPLDGRQEALFRHAVERSLTWVDGVRRTVPEELATVNARAALEAVPTAARRALVREKHGTPFADRLKAAGATWEWLAGWLNDGKGMDADAWSAVIPSMGYMALVRNLRNFEQAGVPGKVLDTVAARIADPAQVAKSRQLPMRFLSAFKEVEGSLRWGWPLEQALTHSLGNVPMLSGRTLILVDLSISMFNEVSERSKLDRWETAAIFGTVLAQRAEHADVVAFGDNSRAVELSPTDSVLTSVRKHFGTRMGGTQTTSAVRTHYRPGFHDRVVILTDEQYSGGVIHSAYNYGYGGHRPIAPTEVVDKATPVYTWNLAGYKVGHGPSGEGNRHTFGGLTDAAFRAIPLIEAGTRGGWPWETATA